VASVVLNVVVHVSSETMTLDASKIDGGGSDMRIGENGGGCVEAAI